MLIITDLNDKEHPIQNGDYIKKDININEKTIINQNFLTKK